MEIGDLVDSEIMQLYPVSFAKEMCQALQRIWKRIPIPHRTRQKKAVECTANCTTASDGTADGRSAGYGTANDGATDDGTADDGTEYESNVCTVGKCTVSTVSGF